MFLCISLEVKHSTALGIVAVLLAMMVLLGPLSGGTLGVFQGRIIAPQGMEARAGWIYVQARNGNARHVEIKDAKVADGEETPKHLRDLKLEDLKPGMTVLITAEQGADGEWHARQIEVIDGPAPVKSSAKKK